MKLPTTQEDVKTLLSYIGVDGLLYEEIFITDYNTDVDGLYDRLGEYESIDELNHLATLLEDMTEIDLEIFGAAAVHGDYGGSVKDLINLAQNLDCYDYFPGVHDNESLGYYLIDSLDFEEIPDRLQNYFDYEAYGRDFDLNENGSFAEGGYILRNGGDFIEHYSGRNDLPDEHRIFAYPDPPNKMSVKQQLEMYGSMAQAHAADRPIPAREERA